MDFDSAIGRLELGIWPALEIIANQRTRFFWAVNSASVCAAPLLRTQVAENSSKVVGARDAGGSGELHTQNSSGAPPSPPGFFSLRLRKELRMKDFVTSA